MKAELQNQLYEKYPSLFREKDLPMNQSNMCFGLEIGDGWYDLVNRVCEFISHHEEYNRRDGYHPVSFSQIKEKFGTLRMYHNGGDNYIDGVISFTEYLSGTICEETGAPGRVMQKNGWYKCVSEEYAKEHGYADIRPR